MVENNEESDEDYDVGVEDEAKDPQFVIPSTNFESKLLPNKEGNSSSMSKFNIHNLNDQGKQ